MMSTGVGGKTSGEKGPKGTMVGQEQEKPTRKYQMTHPRVKG